MHKLLISDLRLVHTVEFSDPAAWLWGFSHCVLQMSWLNPVLPQFLKTIRLASWYPYERFVDPDKLPQYRSEFFISNATKLFKTFSILLLRWRSGCQEGGDQEQDPGDWKDGSRLLRAQVCLIFLKVWVKFILKWDSLTSGPCLEAGDGLSPFSVRFLSFFLSFFNRHSKMWNNEVVGARYWEFCSTLI